MKTIEMNEKELEKVNGGTNNTNFTVSTPFSGDDSNVSSVFPSLSKEFATKKKEVPENICAQGILLWP